jgi:hypothetical protein
VTALDGSPYHLGGPALLASNGLIHAEMQEVSEVAERAAKQ